MEENKKLTPDEKMRLKILKVISRIYQQGYAKGGQSVISLAKDFEKYIKNG